MESEKKEEKDEKVEKKPDEKKPDEKKEDEKKPEEKKADEKKDDEKKPDEKKPEEKKPEEKKPEEKKAEEKKADAKQQEAKDDNFSSCFVGFHAFKAYNGKYLSVDNNGTIYARSSEITGCEMFYVGYDRATGRITLKSWYHRYLHPQTHPRIACTSTTKSYLNEIAVVPCGGFPTFTQSTRNSLKTTLQFTNWSQWLRVFENNNFELKCDPVADHTAVFTAIRLPYFVFRAPNGKLLALNTNTNQLEAKATSMAETTLVHVTMESKNEAYLKMWNGNYVSVGANGVLECKSSVAGKDEKFIFDVFAEETFEDKCNELDPALTLKEGKEDVLEERNKAKALTKKKPKKASDNKQEELKRAASDDMGLVDLMLTPSNNQVPEAPSFFDDLD